ncbi:MAG: family of calcium-binding protein [Parcubacteria group bacterium]|nr:family of calcium-binding protein [Parcubacteria group bacterium]
MTSSPSGFGVRSVIASATILISVIAVLGLVLPSSVFAAGTTLYVDPTASAVGQDGSSAHPYQKIQDAVTAASAGDTIHISGKQTVTSAININIPLTITGYPSAEIDTMGSDYIFAINPGGAGSTISNLTLYDFATVSNDALVLVNANNVSITSNFIRGTYQIGDSLVTRGLDVSSVSGLYIFNNTFWNLRQPAYINNATGTVFHNHTEVTKGWVVVSQSHITFTDNSWGTGPQANVVDIAIIPDSPAGANNYPDVQAISQANHNALVINKAGAVTQQSEVYVNGTTGNDSNDGSNLSPLKTIPTALTRIVANGTVHVAAGTYAGPVTITKSGVSLLGAAGTTVTESTNDQFGYGATVDTASNVTISNIDFVSTQTSGYAFHAFKADGLTLNAVTFTGPGKTGAHIGGLDINTSNTVTLNGVSSTGFYKNGIAVTAKYLASDTGANGITFNNVSSTNNGWSGISFYTIGNDHSPASIGGAASMTSVTFTGTNTISGNSLVGLHIQGDSDANEGAAAAPAYTITTDGTTLDLSHVAFNSNGIYDIANYQTAPVNAMDTTFAGLTGTQMTPAQRSAEDAKISDHRDHAAYGLVRFFTPTPTVPVLTAPVDGAVIPTNEFDFTWGASTEPSDDAITYEFQSSLDSAQTGGVLTNNVWHSGELATPMIHSSGAPDGVWYWQVRAKDASGNYSAWSSIWSVTLDHSVPTATIAFPGTGPSATSFTVTYSKAVNVAEATDPANYFLTNWPGAGGSGPLTGNASVTYDAATHTATVTFTNSAWYLSPEQTWGVGGVHDLAGNEVPPTIALTTPNVAPTAPGTPTTDTPTTSTTQVWNWDASTDVNGSGVASYSYEVLQGSTVITDWTNLGNVTTVTTSLPVGSYTLSVKATDNAGNVGEVSTGSVEVTESAPVDPPATASVSTDAATDVTSSDATLNAKNGALDAAGHSFWVSTSTFSTATPSIPDGVYSTPDMGSIAADGSFTATLSSLTTNGVPGNLPALVPGTTYYYVAWVQVNGTWVPGDMETVTLAADTSGDTLATPAGTFPSNGASLSSSDLTHITWTAVSDAHAPISYVYEVSYDSATSTVDGSFVTPINIGNAGHVTTNEVATGGTPPGTYYWHVRATDSVDTSSDWSSVQSFTITTAAPVNHAPTAGDQTATVAQGSSVAIVLNGADADNDNLTYEVGTAPTHGSVIVSQNIATYTPSNDGYAGTDTFTYNVSDGIVTVPTTGTVTITITPAPHVNAAPTATAQEVSVNENTSNNAITLSGNDADGDSLTYTIVDAPAHGTLSGTAPAMAYTPAADYTGNDTFTFVVFDGTATSSPATVSITVNAVQSTTPTQQNNSFFGNGGGSGVSGQFAAPQTSAPAGSVGGSVLGASTYNFAKNLTVGSHGEDVTQLQTILISEGFLHLDAPSGYFGSLTKAAVKLYQAAHGISPAAGYVGPMTRAVLNQGATPKS